MRRLILRNGFGSFLGLGTGFMISDGLLMTCNHILDAPEAAVSSALCIDPVNDPGAAAKRDLDPGTFFRTSEMWDCTIVAVACGPVPRWIPLGDRKKRVEPGDRVTVVPYAEGRVVRVTAETLWYRVRTPGGSSGAPVIDARGDLVALHHATVPGREDLREGMSMAGIQDCFRIRGASGI